MRKAESSGRPLQKRQFPEDKEKNEEVLLKEFRYFLSKDPIQTTLVDITALGLAEVTRKKVRKPLHEAVREME